MVLVPDAWILRTITLDNDVMKATGNSGFRKVTAAIGVGNGIRRWLGMGYLFEWITLASLAGTTAFLIAGPVRIQFLLKALGLFQTFLIVSLISVVFIVGVQYLSGNRRWRDVEPAHGIFWVNMFRIMVGYSILKTCHFVLKLYRPLLNPANFDQALNRLDLALLGGHWPIDLVSRLFPAGTILSTMDFIYSGLFFYCVWGGVLVFIICLRDQERIRFINSLAVMVQVGLLFYLLVPAFGPIYVWPERFEEILVQMPYTYFRQAILWQETASVIQHNFNFQVRFYGLGAFPSLHVAYFVLYALWARRVGRLWLAWNIVFGVAIFFGSMLTGYHYLVDSLSGLVLGWVAYRVGSGTLAPGPPSESVGKNGAGRMLPDPVETTAMQEGKPCAR